MKKIRSKLKIIEFHNKLYLITAFYELTSVNVNKESVLEK